MRFMRWHIGRMPCAPTNDAKTIIAHSFQNFQKTTFDVGKTMSYVGKIMSDVIQTTSDLFRAFAGFCFSGSYKGVAI